MYLFLLNIRNFKEIIDNKTYTKKMTHIFYKLKLLLLKLLQINLTFLLLQ
jgi:hypothetical protein